MAREVFKTGDWAITFDLKSAYHHIEIMEEHRTFLGFAWADKGTRRYYVFNVLPFGLATAGYVFSKTMREVVAYWRSLGFKVVMYLDDGLTGSADENDAERLSDYIRNTLKELGFLIAEEKCKWEPKPKVT